jgi:hypothetical protein
MGLRRGYSFGAKSEVYFTPEGRKSGELSFGDKWFGRVWALGAHMVYTEGVQAADQDRNACRT